MEINDTTGASIAPLFRLSRDAVCGAVHGSIAFANPAACRLFGTDITGERVGKWLPGLEENDWGDSFATSITVDGTARTVTAARCGEVLVLTIQTEEPSFPPVPPTALRQMRTASFNLRLALDHVTENELENDEDGAYASILFHSYYSILHLTNQLADVNALAAGTMACRMQSVSISHLVDDLLGSAEFFLRRKNIKFRWEISGDNLFVVGDPDQTIYTWRGANIRYLLDFDQVFPGTRTILMMENYRSTPQILSVANSLIARNTDRMEKSLLPTLPDGAPVRLHHARSAADEAAWMAAQMQALHDGGTPYRDMTVLYRAHYLTRTVEEVLQREKIPYTIYSGVQFFGRAEIKDALSYLRMIACQDDLSFLRIVNQPKRNIGERRRRLLQEQAAQEGCSLFTALRRSVGTEAFRGTGAARFVSLIDAFSSDCSGRSVSEVLSAILHESGYEAMLRTEGSQERLDNLAELKQSVYEYETTCGEECTLEHYLAHVALFTNADAGDSSDRVKLMTVHTAKGLEFPHVFLCAMNEGLFPSKKIRTLPAMEEERRLAFVAMTRAEQGLYLSEAAGRNFDGTDRYPSRFLLDIAPGLLEQSGERDDMLLDNARSYIAISERTLRGSADAAAFRPGQRVRHSILGMGTVLELDEAKQAWLIRFDGLPTPRRISFRARLTPCPEQKGDPPS